MIQCGIAADEKTSYIETEVVVVVVVRVFVVRIVIEYCTSQMLTICELRFPDCSFRTRIRGYSIRESGFRYIVNLDLD